jgi:hypothetical protein
MSFFTCQSITAIGFFAHESIEQSGFAFFVQSKERVETKNSKLVKKPYYERQSTATI